MGNVKGTREHDDMARATASCLGKRDEQEGQAGAEGEEGRGTHRGCIRSIPLKRLWYLDPPSTLAP